MLLEAQACGLPVVVGDSGGAPEALASAAAGEVWSPAGGPLATSLVGWIERASRDGRRPVAPWTWAGAAQRLAGVWGEGSSPSR